MKIEILVMSFISILLLGILLHYKMKIKLKPAFRVAFLSGLLAVLILQLLHIYSILNYVQSILFVPIFLCLFSVIIILLNFFRDPDRLITNVKNVILSPADGTVRYVKTLKNGTVPVAYKKNRSIQISELMDTDLMDHAVYLIGIEMNILNVHVNRSPLMGKVIFQKHISGKFLSLRKPESPFENERLTTVLDEGKFKIGIVQIASRMVRRIVTYVNNGDYIERGQRIGMIKFGSQVDLVIPDLKGMIIHVKIGNEVEAGTTIVAEFESND